MGTKTSYIKVNAACSIGSGNSGLTGMYINACNENNWKSSFFIGKRADYDNKGKFYGTPLVWLTQGQFDNIDPKKIFDALNNDGAFTKCLTGVIDWESREAWLSHFTPEEKQYCVETEAYFGII